MWYQITHDALQNLRKSGISSPVVRRLEVLVGHHFEHKRALWRAIQQRLGRQDAIQYKGPILTNLVPCISANQRARRRHIFYHVAISLQVLGIVLMVGCLYPFFVVEDLRTTSYYSPGWLEFLGGHLPITLVLGGGGAGMVLFMGVVRRIMSLRWFRDLKQFRHPQEAHDEWICPACQEATENAWANCWYCGRTRDHTAA
jgi:hypothetical protein